MKKLFTLLFCTAILSSAFAQDDGRNWHDHDGYRDHHHREEGVRYDNNFFVYQNNRYWFSQRDEVIQRISRKYNYQIQYVINDWSLSSWRKRYEIRELQAEKAQEINMVISQCNNQIIYSRPYHRHDDDDD